MIRNGVQRWGHLGRGGVEEDFQRSVPGGVPIHSDRCQVTGAWVLAGRWL